MLTGKWTEVLSEADYEAAIKLAKGSYQLSILNGHESMSGSTLKGKAASYGTRYRNSRYNLLDRCRKAGIDISVQKRDHGRLVLVIGL